jgi:hypothetical protein
VWVRRDTNVSRVHGMSEDVEGYVADAQTDPVAMLLGAIPRREGARG